MDLANLQTRAIASRVDLVSPVDGERLEHDGKIMFVSVLGEDSAEYKQEITNQVRFAQKKKNTEFDYDDAILKSARLFAAVTVEMEIYYSGEWIKFNLSPDSTREEQDKARKTAKEIYISLPFIREQVKDVIEDRANFLDQSVKG
jgi:hypothetical protein